MDLRLLCIAALSGLLGFCNAQEEVNDCIKARAKFCGECIQASERCAWCSDPAFLKQGEASSARCDEMESLVRKGCNISTIENPRGGYAILKNEPVSLDERLPLEQITQFQPQKISLTLRSGERQTFSLKFTRVGSPSSEVILGNSKLPEGVSITYKSICKNGIVGTGEDGRKCSDISLLDEVSFEIAIESQKCPSKGKPETIKITPQGFTEEVEVVLNFICECECHKDGQLNSEPCNNGNGTFECGACRCNEGRVGPQCECSLEELWGRNIPGDLDTLCRRDDSEDVCSNNGDCVCGSCWCKKRENPEERYSGRFCECDNFNCDRSNNKLCGGHGRCECRVCICDANWAGSACDCSLDTSTCLAANKQICNGRGTCECGECRCTDPKFLGPTCEICPLCPGVCTEHKDCVQCRAFGTGEKKNTCERDCNYLNLIRISDRAKMPDPSDLSYPLSHCKERDANDCWFYYTYAVRNFNREVHVVEKLECP